MASWPPPPLEKRQVTGELTACVASDIHPWEILINGERWPGKVRLVGFVDVFFLISYSSESRFEKGLVIYSKTPAVQSPVS